jgi:acetophenone carboxylase
MSAVHNCFGKMLFCTEDMWKQVSASQANAGQNVVIAGMSQWKLPFADMIAYPLNTDGQGGKPNSDGIDAFGFAWCVFGRAQDIEELENEFPILIAISNHWKDSCGHGKYRGGVGTVQLWIAHHTPEVLFTSTSDNSKVQTPQPLFGGYAPCTLPGISVKDSDVMEIFGNRGGEITLDFHELILNKQIKGDWSFEFYARPIRPFKKGDIINFTLSCGGAGYGDPLDRDPELVIEDIKKHIISHWSAQNIYKVSYNPETLKLDLEKTKKLREEERRARINRGKPFDEFIKEWEKKRPPENILNYYGSWPHAEPVQPIYRP